MRVGACSNFPNVQGFLPDVGWRHLPQRELSYVPVASPFPLQDRWAPGPIRGLSFLGKALRSYSSLITLLCTRRSWGLADNMPRIQGHWGLQLAFLPREAAALLPLACSRPVPTVGETRLLASQKALWEGDCWFRGLLTRWPTCCPTSCVLASGFLAQVPVTNGAIGTVAAQTRTEPRLGTTKTDVSAPVRVPAPLRASISCSIKWSGL